MKCVKCDSEWSSKIQVEKCPFCGTLLVNIGDSNMSMVKAIRVTVQKYGVDILLSSHKVQAIIMDLVNGCEREKKLFKIACENGLLQNVYEILKLKNNKEISILASKCKRQLEYDAFLSEEYAVTVIEMVFKALNINHHFDTKPVYTKPDEDLEEKGYGDFEKIIVSKKKPSREECMIIFEKGKALIDSNIDLAIRGIRFAAQHGINDAAILLGECYENGRGVSKDWKIAEAYYRQAAVSGNHEAEYRLGILLKNNQRTPECEKWIQKALEAGHPAAIRDKR